MVKNVQRRIVRCPDCGKQRLFDVNADVKGIITIKCQKCGHVVEIDLENVDLPSDLSITKL